jgi:polar amino acid transport system substrate-binding protein
MHYNLRRDCMKQCKVVFVAAGLILTSCLSSHKAVVIVPEDKLAEVQARQTLIIATDADYLPQSRLLPDVHRNPDTKCESSQYTTNQFTGFDVEVAVEIARRLGVEACFVTPPWSQLVAGNWGDNWDVHVGSVAITYDRMKALYFSQPYYATPTVILVHKKNSTFHSPEDLSGKRIGICAGCTFEEYLQGTLQIPGEKIEYRIQNPQIIAYENEDPAIDALSLGDGVKLDAVITILPKARAAINAGKPVRMLAGPLLFAYAAVTLDRSSGRNPLRLLNEITKIIQEMHHDGTLKKMSIEYQGLDLTQEASQFNLISIKQAP